LESSLSEKRDLFLHEALKFCAFMESPWSGRAVPDEEEAIKAAKALGFPVAMKVISRKFPTNPTWAGLQLKPCAAEAG